MWGAQQRKECHSRATEKKRRSDAQEFRKRALLLSSVAAETPAPPRLACERVWMWLRQESKSSTCCADRCGRPQVKELGWPLGPDFFASLIAKQAKHWGSCHPSLSRLPRILQQPAAPLCICPWHSPQLQLPCNCNPAAPDVRSPVLAHLPSRPLLLCLLPR